MTVHVYDAYYYAHNGLLHLTADEVVNLYTHHHDTDISLRLD